MSSPKKALSQSQQEQIRQLEARLQDFERLTKVLENISSTMPVEDTLKRIIEATLELCNADQGSIFLFGPGGQQEAKTLIREGGARKEKLDRYLNRLLAGWITSHNQPLLTNSLIDTFGKKNVKAKYSAITSVLSVPLVLQGETMGVINLVSESKEQKFAEREERLVGILASQCAHFIHNAQLHEKLFAETARLKQEVHDKYALQGIIGYSPKMQAVFSLLERVIPTSVRVLLEGESGTGKERIARAIHYNGPHKDAPFVAVDCGALPANLLESELFGYVKGAFTGADRDHKGLFEEAHGGTLFLDEIANMPLEVQAKFLRAVQEGEIRPLGSSQVKKVDVRIIAAASGNLRQLVEEGNFREDLFYRLNVATITLPPLRERREDIAILAKHFLKSMNEKHQLKIKGFARETLFFLESFPWPGNIRELEHAVERAMIFSESDRLAPDDFAFLKDAIPANSTAGDFRPRPLKDALNELKREYVSRVMEYTGGSQKEAAKILQIQPTYLSRLIKELRIGDL